MTVEDLKRQASETWEACLRFLPKELATKMRPPKGDPAILAKGRKPMRLRVAPGKKVPKGFWTSGWTGYEILIGNLETAPGEGLVLGCVSFVQSPYQKECGDGFFARPVADILKLAHNERPTDFRLKVANGISGCTSLTRRYYVRDFRSFPVDTAGQDLAWLIASTFPRIELLPDAPAKS